MFMALVITSYRIIGVAPLRGVAELSRLSGTYPIG